jgi:hypothetical protein
VPDPFHRRRQQQGLGEGQAPGSWLRVVLPLAGGPISRWQRSGAAVAEGKEGRRRDVQSLSQVNRARQGWFTDVWSLLIYNFGVLARKCSNV